MEACKKKKKICINIHIYLYRWRFYISIILKSGLVFAGNHFPCLVYEFFFFFVVVYLHTHADTQIQWTSFYAHYNGQLKCNNNSIINKQSITNNRIAISLQHNCNTTPVACCRNKIIACDYNTSSEWMYMLVCVGLCVYSCCECLVYMK